MNLIDIILHIQFPAFISRYLTEERIPALSKMDTWGLARIYLCMMVMSSSWPDDVKASFMGVFVGAADKVDGEAPVHTGLTECVAHIISEVKDTPEALEALEDLPPNRFFPPETIDLFYRKMDESLTSVDIH